MEEKLNTILALAESIQQAGGHYVFISYSGHVELMEVSITEKPEFSKKLYDEAFYLHPSSLYKEDKLDEVIDELEEFIYERY